ncbi:hypothetical protein J6590_014153 [Homalodisca vitripennis]|nr:hypothetical protein J6590_014153 [Homalodisca vitripennis]
MDEGVMLQFNYWHQLPLPKPSGKEMPTDGGDPESDSGSELSDLFGDPSSDEYRPDFDDLSDSDKEEDFATARARPDNNKLIQNDTIIPDSDDDLKTLSDDVVGPSDEDEGLPRVLQVVNPDHLIALLPSKREKQDFAQIKNFENSTRAPGRVEKT